MVGREVTFPESIINSINEKSGGKVVAELITVGGIRLDEPKKYDVIIDRISHEVPYYRAMLKRMALVIDDGIITKVFYPVFPPDKNAEEVISWLRASR